MNTSAFEFLDTCLVEKVSDKVNLDYYLSLITATGNHYHYATNFSADKELAAWLFYALTSELDSFLSISKYSSIEELEKNKAEAASIMASGETYTRSSGMRIPA